MWHKLEISEFNSAAGIFSQESQRLNLEAVGIHRWTNKQSSTASGNCITIRQLPADCSIVGGEK